MRICTWLAAQVLFLLSFSQDSTKLQLFKPGTQLEYQSYFPDFGSFGKQKGYRATTKMVYVVKEVKRDSMNNISTAIIEKRGYAYNSPQEFFWKSYLEISCSNDMVSFPVGYYMVDTIYYCDINDGGYYKKAHTIYSITQTEAKTINYPVSAPDSALLDNISYGFNGYVYNPDIAGIDAFSRGKTMPDAQSSRLSKTRFDMSATTTVRKVQGKVKVRTPAGTFTCYKISVSTEHKIGKGTRKLNSVEYFSPELGIVKTEFLDFPNPGYIELIRVKRAR